MTPVAFDDLDQVRDRMILTLMFRFSNDHRSFNLVFPILIVLLVLHRAWLPLARLLLIHHPSFFLFL